MSAVALILIKLAIGAARLIGVLLLAVLLPIYALALASVALMISILLAIAIVPVGRLIVEHNESKATIEESPAKPEDEEMEWRKAA